MKNSSNGSAGGGGVGFLSLLVLLFVGLKLGGVISWPWVWVFAPWWIPISIAIVIVLGAFGIALAKRR